MKNNAIFNSSSTQVQLKQLEQLNTRGCYLVNELLFIYYVLSVVC